MRTPLIPLPWILVLSAALPATPSARAEETVAVSARASSDYARTRLADGSLQPETFAFAKGGLLKATEAGIKEPLAFGDVARTIARPLEAQGYYSSRDPKSTRLLIVVYWGTTTPPLPGTRSVSAQNLADAGAAALAANHPDAVRFNPNDSCAPTQITQSATTSYAVRTPEQVDLDGAFTGALAAVAAEEGQRRLLDLRNAGLLGFDQSWLPEDQARGTALQVGQKDLVGELEDPRYFVVLMAYDFQMMWKEKKAKLLWEARFSVREGSGDFSRQLAAMAERAAPYFGRNSGKLVHAPLPDGRVEIGPIQSLEPSQRTSAADGAALHPQQGSALEALRP